ncbi:MAG: hypothetical protein ACI8TQ_002495 [Planctomycetota bacterium]|jgi:hypothetical protein
MGVLTITEDGEQRAFRISEGTLSVGSGESVDLRLNATDVAGHHANLECVNENLLIEPLPGVTPPTINGVNLKKKTRLGPGQDFRIGQARISWKVDESIVQAVEAEPVSSSKSASKPKPRSSSKSSSKPQSRSTTKSKTSSSRRATSTRSKSSLPAVAIVGIILAIVGLGFLFFNRQLEKSNSVANEANAHFHLRKAEEMMDALNTDVAQDHLDKLVKSGLTAEENVRYKAVEQRIQAEFAKINQEEQQIVGSKWFEPNLEVYEKYYLTGTPDLARVRMFLERCAEFRKRWPNHAKIGWVERQERRFANTTGLDQPPGYADVMWRAKLYTDTRPKDFGQALALLEGYRDKAETAEERVGLGKFVDELIETREEYHHEQLRFARGEYEKGNVSRAIEWLVQSIIGLGDKTMADEAAEILIKFAGVESVLLGYREMRADDYALLIKNEIVADFMSDVE